MLFDKDWISTQSERGLTLIELLVVLSIAGILLAVGIPSFTRIMDDNRAQSDVTNLLGALKLARSEAVTRGGSVTVCPTVNQAACSANWADPLMVFVDADEDAVPDDANAIVRVYQDPSRFRVVATMTLANSRSIVFRSNGRAVPSGVISVCDANDVIAARAVVVNVTGSVQLDRGQAQCP